MRQQLPTAARAAVRLPPSLSLAALITPSPEITNFSQLSALSSMSCHPREITSLEITSHVFNEARSTGLSINKDDFYNSDAKVFFFLTWNHFSFKCEEGQDSPLALVYTCEEKSILLRLGNIRRTARQVLQYSSTVLFGKLVRLLRWMLHRPSLELSSEVQVNSSALLSEAAHLMLLEFLSVRDRASPHSSLCF